MSAIWANSEYMYSLRVLLSLTHQRHFCERKDHSRIVAHFQLSARAKKPHSMTCGAIATDCVASGLPVLPHFFAQARPALGETRAYSIL